MTLELAQNRINLLDVRQLSGDYYAVMYEYQYINRDRSRTWQKDLLITTTNNPLFLVDEVKGDIIKRVKQARAELER